MNPEVLQLFVTFAVVLKQAVDSLKATGDTAYGSIATLVHFEAMFEDGIYIRSCKKGSKLTHGLVKDKLLAASDLVLTLANHEQPEVIVECEGIFDLLSTIAALREELQETHV